MREHATDTDRRLSNVALYGTIEEADHDKRLYRVRAGNILTGWLRYAGTRAGALNVWSPLTKGEQVLVLSPSGDLAQGSIVGTLESADNPSPGNDGQTINVVFPDGSKLSFGGGTLDFNTTAAVKIKAGSIEMEASEITIKGPVNQSGGDITAATDVWGGGISLKTHVHSGVQTGSSNTSQPA